MDELKKIQLSDLSDISLEYFGCFDDETGVCQSLVVKFFGDFGSSSNLDDALFMQANVAAGIEAWNPKSVVIDLTEFKYDWGSYLQNVFCVVTKKRVNNIDEALSLGVEFFDSSSLDLRVVVSDENRESVESLLEDEMKLSSDGIIFDDLDSAVNVNG